MRDRLDDSRIRLPSASPRRPLLLLLSFFALATLLLVLDQNGTIQPFRDRASSVLTYALQTFVGVRSQAEDLSREVGDVTRLREENEQLRAEIAQLKGEMIKAEPLILENERLRRQLRIEETTPWKLLGADVSAFTPDAGRRTIMVARGSNDGIQPGMAVIGQEGTSPPSLIGVVEQVEPRNAVVLLITDYGSEVSAQVYNGQDVVQGLLHGQWQRGARLHLEQIPRSARIEGGSVVLTAGLSRRVGASLAMAAIPPGVPVGSITSVQAADHTQTAEVQPFVDPDQVRYVWIILSHDD